MVTLSVAIMAHKNRARMVEANLRQLNRENPGHTIPVVWDRHSDRWDTGSRALQAHYGGATHHLVLQDDIALSARLLRTVQQLLPHVPDGHPVSLYQGRGRTLPRRYSFRPMLRTIRQQAAPFAVYPGPWWGQAVIVPTDHISHIVTWGTHSTDAENYDHKIATYYHHHGIDCWYTTPSLVQHRHGIQSLIEGRSPNTTGRQALWFTRRPPKPDWWQGTPYRPQDPMFPPTPHSPGWLDNADV